MYAPVIVLPIYVILFHLYPSLTLKRVLITTTEYSPNRDAIQEILGEQALELKHTKEEVVGLLRREKVRGLMREAAAHGTQELENSFEQMPARTRTFVDKAYYASDTNSDSFLDAEEFRKCISSLKLHVDESHVTYHRDGYVRPASEEWFQILAPDMRGVTHTQFKVIVWALSSANDVALEEEVVLQCLQRISPKTSSVNAAQLQALVISLTCLPNASPAIGHAFLRESFLLKSETRVMPEGYRASMADIAKLITVIDKDLATQQGLD